MKSSTFRAPCRTFWDIVPQTGQLSLPTRTSSLSAMKSLVVIKEHVFLVTSDFFTVFSFDCNCSFIIIEFTISLQRIHRHQYLIQSNRQRRRHHHILHHRHLRFVFNFKVIFERLNRHLRSSSSSSSSSSSRHLLLIIIFDIFDIFFFVQFAFLGLSS